jgi:hypothetical protein
MQPVALAGTDAPGELPRLLPDRPFPVGALSWLEDRA